MPCYAHGCSLLLQPFPGVEMGVLRSLKWGFAAVVLMPCVTLLLVQYVVLDYSEVGVESDNAETDDFVPAGARVMLLLKLVDLLLVKVLVATLWLADDLANAFACWLADSVQ
ncbi:hypothetical protein Nepgr_014829 [Nepenthes gracilis]|uniref:Uncharacterized protein n=1 Tax=Nepenthes gracilis TaxID=150966 RepID=A0AAD3XQ75_NEPGR|nr:hypothetical protein Nepgr_014829 [Nepenthes gracilis]